MFSLAYFCTMKQHCCQGRLFPANQGQQISGMMQDALLTGNRMLAMVKGTRIKTPVNPSRNIFVCVPGVHR